MQSKTLLEELLYSLLPLLLQVLTLLVPILLWRLADRIAKWAVKTNHVMSIQGAASQSLQSVLFCAAGLFIFLTALSPLIQWIIQYIMFVVRSTPVYTAPYAPMPYQWISLVL